MLKAVETKKTRQYNTKQEKDNTTTTSHQTNIMPQKPDHTIQHQTIQRNQNTTQQT